MTFPTMAALSACATVLLSAVILLSHVSHLLLRPVYMVKQMQHKDMLIAKKPGTGVARPAWK